MVVSIAGINRPALGCLSRALFLILLAASGCAVTHDVTGQTQIDRSFTPGGARWEEGGVVYVFSKVRENQGKTEVCVAFMPDEKVKHHGYYNRQGLAAASVYVAGKRVMHGLGFANELAYNENFGGLPATCARGSVDWQPEFADSPSEVRFARMRFVQ